MHTTVGGWVVVTNNNDNNDDNSNDYDDNDDNGTDYDDSDSIIYSDYDYISGGNVMMMTRVVLEMQKNCNSVNY